MRSRSLISPSFRNRVGHLCGAPAARLAQGGFSLVELMVGVAIGLVAMLVVFQVLSIWDTRRRTTTSGGDAQVAGTIAIYLLDRDVRLGGWGFGDVGAGYCSTVNGYNSARQSGPTTFPFSLVPVKIDYDPTGKPDAIEVLYGNSSVLSEGQQFVTSTPFSKKALTNSGFLAPNPSNTTGPPLQSTAPVGAAPGDLVVVSNTSGACDLIQVSDHGATEDLQTFYHNPGVSTFNRAGGTVASYTTGMLYNLGPIPQWRKWSIPQLANGNPGNVLQWQEQFTNAPATDVTEGIVDMRAEYGIDNSPQDDNISPNEWTSTAPTNTPSDSWSRVLAIRVGMLARSQRYEKPDPTLGCTATTVVPTWSGSNANGRPTSNPFRILNLDGTAGNLNNPYDWRCYRYRVYEKVIPLRNVIWGTSTS